MDEMMLQLFSNDTHFVVAELSGKKDFHTLLLLQDLLPPSSPSSSSSKNIKKLATFHLHFEV
jgi:hypothetical protein